MEDGYVYILINPSLKGILKIGSTKLAPEKRASQLSTTGLPMPFFVAFSKKVSDCRNVEREIHNVLKKKRVNNGREFFRIDLETGIKIVTEISETYQIYSNESQIRDNTIKKIQTIKTAQRVKNAQKVKTVQTVKTICSNCSRRYKVTLIRYEDTVMCPSCRNTDFVDINW